MKYKYFVILIILFSTNYANSQVLGINGGILPNGLKGTHFGSKILIPLKNKFNLSLNYQLVKYSDIYAEPSSFNTLHKENKSDKPLIHFNEFDRGISIQVNNIDFRPKYLNHSFSILLGYQIFENPNVAFSIKIGPHISFNRTYNHSFSVNPATIKFTESSNHIQFPYYDYEIFRSWDIGPTGRLDFEYMLFENVSIGLMSTMYMDVISEGIDLCAGISLSFYFSNK